MKFSITTPLAVAADVPDVSYVRAEDATGAFGILPGHADFLTTLTVSVVTWRTNGVEHHMAVRGGVLTVRGGDEVAIVTREAVGEDSLAQLGEAVITEMRKEQESEVSSRLSGTRIELAALRQIERYLAGRGDQFNRPGLYRGRGATSPDEFPSDGTGS
jgi:F-type H+-transporting ATPase subunit epsilon